jgi:PAB1-binding protein PBP1
MTENKIKLQTHKKTYTKLQIKRKEIQNTEEKLVSNHWKHDEYDITKIGSSVYLFKLSK